MVFVQVTSHARYVYSKLKETLTFFVLHSKACHEGMDLQPNIELIRFK